MDGRRKNYRAWDPQQNGHDAISPRDALPEDDLVFFLIDLIPQLDLTPFHQYYAQELRGQPPFDVTMMVTLLVYAYAVGVRSSRKIAAACERNLAFRAIVGHDRPDFRTISDFRKIHLAALKPLFLEVLRLAGEMGMVKLGNLSTDGTKMGANASRHKAMSYGYMDKEIERLKAEIERLLQDAEQLDAEQDAALGSRRGDELPAELKRREDRLAKIREAKARLEAEARAKAEEEQRRRDEAQAQREAEGRKRRGKEPAPIEPTPEDKARNELHRPRSEDHEAEQQGVRLFVQRSSGGGWRGPDHRGGGGDPRGQRQAAGRADGPSGPGEPGGGRDRAAEGGRRDPAPIPNTADTGYFSEEAVEGLEQIGMDPYMAVERQKHHEAAAEPESTATSGGGECEGEDAAQTAVRRPARPSTRRGSRSSSRSSARSRGRGASAGFCCEAWRRSPPSGN